MGPYHDDQPFPPHIHRLRWRRGLLTAVVFAAVAAGCGKSSSLSTDVANPGDAEKVTLAVGSDRHLNNQATEIARRERANAGSGSDTHLVNLAREAARHNSASTGSDRHLEELARQAEAVTQPRGAQ